MIRGYRKYVLALCCATFIQTAFSAENVAVYIDLPAEAVLARVNDRVLTKGDIERNLAMVERLTTRKRDDLSLRALERFRMTYRSAAPRQFVTEALLAEAAEKVGVTNTTACLQRFQAAAFRTYRTRREKTFDDLKKVKGIDGELLERRVAAEALVETMRNHWLEHEPCPFGESYAEVERAARIKANEVAALTNQLSFARATNAWMRLEQGEDFLKVGLEMTELPEEREEDLEWGALDEEEMDDEPALLAAVKKLKVGAYTPPIRTDNGVAIIKLTGFDAEAKSYEMSRIYFHLAELWELKSKEELIAEAQRDYVGELYRKKLKELHQAAKIEFPFKTIDFKTKETEE